MKIGLKVEYSIQMEEMVSIYLAKLDFCKIWEVLLTKRQKKLDFFWNLKNVFKSIKWFN